MYLKQKSRIQPATAEPICEGAEIELEKSQLIEGGNGD
jgi:hypothetical protein